MKESAAELELKEVPGELISIDSFVFLVGLFFALFYLYSFSKGRGFSRYLFFFLLCYIICSFSSYNIMVMPIHDFNIPIARNFIYHYKLYSILSPLDIVSIVFLFFVLSRVVILKADYFNVNPFIIKILALIVLQAVFIAVISSFGYYVHLTQGGVVSFKDHAVYIRGVIYFLTILILFFKIYPELKNYNFYDILKLFIVIDIINFISGLISCGIYYDFLWERYGIKVTIIDQDKIYNYFTMYVLIFVAMTFSFSKPVKFIHWGVLIIGLFMFLNIYKFIFAIAAIFLFYDILISAFSGGKYKLKIALSALVIALTLPATAPLLVSKSMGTRSSQLNDYWEYTGHYFPANLIGIGYGGKYISPTGVADKGETKKIDQYPEGEVVYKKSIQMPMLTQIKNSGAIGLSFMLVMALVFIHLIIHQNVMKNITIFSTAIFFNILWLAASTSIVIQPYPMPSLSFFKLLILAVLLIHFKDESGKRQPITENFHE
ncbi:MULTISPECIES: hypothetical protein [Serratia]|jgi:hypothetical protein|uniref:hypothetical protein n=1 Tax=Serratia TaxID=613 RepID=UPI0018D72549|nr:hypothetical protein [Serratia marcescens]MBH2969778.1 hypothetical protein [Serratia marcescens]MBN6137697.1 hypothetical protein [Serratia marcescens]